MNTANQWIFGAIIVNKMTESVSRVDAMVEQATGNGNSIVCVLFNECKSFLPSNRISRPLFQTSLIFPGPRLRLRARHEGRAEDGTHETCMTSILCSIFQLNILVPAKRRPGSQFERCGLCAFVLSLDKQKQFARVSVS